MFARLIKYAAAAAVAVWLWRRAGRRRARLTSAGATQRMHLLRRRSQGRAAAHAPFAAALAKLDAERKAADQAARDDSAQQMPPPPNPRPRASRAAAAESTEQGLQDEYSDTMDGSHGVEHVLNEFILESGARLHHVCTRLSTFGALDEARSNCVLVVHALTGTHEVHAWWGSLVGPGKPLDTDRFMVVCMNTLGSCFGTCGPASADPSHATGRPYGPRFPETTIRDAAELQASGVVGRQNHRPPHVTTSNYSSITTYSSNYSSNYKYNHPPQSPADLSPPRHHTGKGAARGARRPRGRLCDRRLDGWHDRARALRAGGGTKHALGSATIHQRTTLGMAGVQRRAISPLSPHYLQSI